MLLGRAVSSRLVRTGALLLTHALWMLALAAPVSAQAPARPYGRADPLLPVRFDAHAAMTWDGWLGLGGRLDIPIATAAGLRYSSRDEVAISLGTDLTFLAFDGESRVTAYPTLTFQWSMGVSDRFYFYPELGLVTRIDRDGWDGVSANLGFGARYYLQRSFGIFGRLGFPFALSGGAMF